MVVTAVVRTSVTCAVCATALLGAAPAVAAPAKAVTGSFPLPAATPDGDGFCPFDVRVDFMSTARTTEETLPDGSTLMRFRGATFATVTNVDTGAFLELNVSGPGEYVFAADGSFSGDVRGLNLLQTTVANSAAGVPQLNFTRGRATFDVNSDQFTTDFRLRGRSTDVCAALSRPA